MQQRYKDERIIQMFKSQDVDAQTGDLCLWEMISDATFYEYKSKYSGIETSYSKTLKELKQRIRSLKYNWQSGCWIEQPHLTGPIL